MNSKQHTHLFYVFLSLFTKIFVVDGLCNKIVDYCVARFMLMMVMMDSLDSEFGG